MGQLDPYTAVDFQLLFEVCVALDGQCGLPSALLRVLEARGWVLISPDSVRDLPRRDVDGEELPSETGDFLLTRAGRREVDRFCDAYDYEALRDWYASFGDTDGSAA